MALKLLPVHIRVVERTGITADDEAQSRILARAIIQEMHRIGKAQPVLDDQPRFHLRLPSV